MEGRQERPEPLDRAHGLSSLSGGVEAVARGDRSMQQCPDHVEDLSMPRTKQMQHRLGTRHRMPTTAAAEGPPPLG
jgi:hypothetical protein